MRSKIVFKHRSSKPKSKGYGTSSQWAKEKSSKSSVQHCPLCGESNCRDQENRRHIKDVHLPDSICCPGCSWHGKREKALIAHLKVCPAKSRPELWSECEIYNTKWMLDLYLVDSVPFETVVTLAIACIEERGLVLGKLEAWGPLDKWRKQTVQVLVKMEME